MNLGVISGKLFVIIIQYLGDCKECMAEVEVEVSSLEDTMVHIKEVPTGE